jgi:hypothetical protein
MEKASNASTMPQSLRVAYNVFLSHKGPDVKKHFAYFLDCDLKLAGVLPFLDEIDLEPGVPAWNIMEAALRGAKLVLVIMFTTYMESRWCRRKLGIMMDDEVKGKVIPVLYDVSTSLNGLVQG